MCTETEKRTTIEKETDRIIGFIKDATFYATVITSRNIALKESRI